MRTMLTLVLLCSLAQFAITEVPDSELFLPEGCGHNNYLIYPDCFAPQSCYSSGISLTNSEITKDSRQKVIKKCPAFMKLYSYGDHWFEVSLESFDPTVTSVEFIHQDKNEATKNKLACKPNLKTGKWEGSYNNIVMGIFDSCKCEFDVRLGASQDVFKGEDTDYGLFKINDQITTKRKGDITLSFITHPRPSNLMFNAPDQPDSKHVYAEVKHKFGEYHCQHRKISTFQYREDKGEYKNATNNVLNCPKSDFQDASVKLAEYMDARCVSDAKYFCDYKPKSSENMIYSAPDKETPKAGELKCSHSHPHLFVGGNPVFKEGTRNAPEIECFNYGKKQFWTVNGYRLTEKGPDVHCSDKLPCDRVYKIKESSVYRGTLNALNYPICFANGILYDEQNQKVENFRCDETTGEYKYDAGTEVKSAEGISFTCKYPTIADEERDKQNERVLAMGVVGAGIGCGLLVFVGVGIVLWYTRRVLRIEHQKQQAARDAEDEQNYRRLAMTKKERWLERKRRQELKNDPNTTPSSSAASEDKFAWNDMIMSTEYKAECHRNRSELPGTSRRTQESTFNASSMGELKEPTDAKVKNKDCKKPSTVEVEGLIKLFKLKYYKMN